ncbi:MAG TPA: hypothetical protein VGX92_13815 [Pyrinomonadaceae bacterium]|jgi:hypothetical protein|nr:hypothetical protein [Pyrinomonadaceae bacterium]
MSILKPWADGPFELILHAELQMERSDDFARRIALISFDNSIEVSVTTYLSLNPLQRQNRQYQRVDVDRWLNNYHTKLDFFFEELLNRGLTVSFEKADVVWCHDVRNGQYHGGGPTIPRERELTEARKFAILVFSILFDVSDVENLLKIRISELTGNDLPKRDVNSDKLIDERYGVVRVGGIPYYTSELLYSVDPFAYGDRATKLKSGIDPGDGLETE